MAELFSILRTAVDSRQDILDVGETYQEVADVTLSNADVGTYEFCMSVTSSFNQTTKSKYFQFSLDGGTTWEEARYEPKDNTDRVYDVYVFPYVNAVQGADLQITVQARKEDSAGTFDIHFMNAWIKRIA